MTEKTAKPYAHRLALSETIQSLRLSAALIYDRGMAAKLSPEQMAESLRPLQEVLKETLAHAAHHDLPGCVIAVERLQHQAEAHKKDAQFLLTKAEDALNHVEHLKSLIILSMTARKVEEWQVADFIATITTTDGKARLTLR